MLRLEINPRRGEGPRAQYASTDLEPVDIDPFASTGPVQARGGTGGGGAASAPRDLEPIEFDPFASGRAPPAAAPVVSPGPSQGPAQPPPSPPMQPGPVWEDEPGYLPGLLGTGASRFNMAGQVPVTLPNVPLTRPRPEERHPIGKGLDFAERMTRTFWGLQQPDRSYADRAAEAAETVPTGTGRVPYFGADPAETARVTAQVRATPPAGPTGQVLTNPTPGTVPYDPQTGDQFGGAASPLTLAKASLVPLTGQENLEKRIAILAADLGVPADRFFTHGGQIKYADMKGNVFAVAPSPEGGSWYAPLDMAKRYGSAAAQEAGQGAVMGVGMAGGLLAGPEAYAPSAAVAAGLSSAVADYLRQEAGNVLAKQAGYRRPAGQTGPDVDLWNVLGQGVQNAGFEAFARMAPALLTNLFPNLFGQNPYRLTGVEAQDLARVLEDDARTGGSVLKRALVSQELGLHLTPRDLLTVTNGIGGSDPGVWNLRARLYNSLAQHENTLASLGGKRGASAADLMRQYYLWKARVNFPEAVQKLLGRISAEESPAAGFETFRQASGRVLDYLEQSRMEAGFRNGWRSLFSSGSIRADPSRAIAQAEQRLEHAAGPIRQEIGRVLGELRRPATFQRDGGTARGFLPVDDIERLHQVRLDLMRRIEELRGPGKGGPARTELANELQGIHDVLLSELQRNPLYHAGDIAFGQASSRLTDAKRGILSLTRRNPLHQERLGGALADSGPTVIRAARDLFEEAGEAAAWNANTRAYLEINLRNAGGGGGMTAGTGTGFNAGLAFANAVANQPKTKAGLLEMVADPKTRELLDGLIDAGYAFDLSIKDLAQLSKDAVKPDARRLNPKGSRLVERMTGLLSPLQALRTRGNNVQEWLDTRGAATQAYELMHPGMTHYRNMTDTALPLAGRRGEILERGLYAAAPLVHGTAENVPRPSPQWLAEQGIPWLLPPPERDPRAPDLRRVLGPSPIR